MADLQWLSGQSVATPIVAVAGNSLKLKVLPGPGEKLPLTIVSSTPAVAAGVEVNNRMGPNFTTFILHAVLAGQTNLSILSGDRVVYGPVQVRVQPVLTLPDPTTDAGLLARLLLAEAPNPTLVAANAQAQLTESMRLMRVVVENRRAKPSNRWGSQGATSLGDVIRAPGQFHGLGGYPTIAGDVLANINNILRLANEAGDQRQPVLRAHVEAVLQIARGPRPPDPTGGKLYWWRTAGSGAPSSDVVLYKTLAGNSFYQER